jgi:molybdate transport system substrate-binding protein
MAAGAQVAARLHGATPARQADRASWVRVGTLAGLVACGAAWAVACSVPREQAPARVAAAADLARAFPEVAAAFTQATGKPVVLSFGSSGVLATQLAAGAPFDAFASADVDLLARAIAAGACRAESRVFYARGQLALWWRDDLRVSPPRTFTDLADTRFTRVAIASPEHAPYGRAARQAMVAAGIWPAVEPRLVYGENVQQVLQFAATGNAEVAVVARALAVRTPGAWLAIDETLHQPLRQAMAACVNGPSPEAGDGFVRFVVSPAGQAILARNGFAPSEVEGR